MINKLKSYWWEIQHIYRIYRFNKLIRDEALRITSLPEDEAMIQIVRWRWDLSKINLSEKAENAWEKWLQSLEKIVKKA